MFEEYFGSPVLFVFCRPDWICLRIEWIMGKFARLEVADEALSEDGDPDTAKARPLMMTGTRKGMNFCTITNLSGFEPFSAMFPDGRDPLGKKYREI